MKRVHTVTEIVRFWPRRLTPARQTLTSSATRRCAPHLHSAFTLIELMIVVGLIILLVGGAGIALSGRGGEGVALNSAQSALSALVGATRAEAALHQTTARLLIYAAQPPTGDAGKFLRYLQVVRAETGAGATTVWVAAGDAVTLPSPICVVPPGNAVSALVPRGITWDSDAATGPVSTLAGPLRSFTVNGQSAVGGRFVAGQLFGGAGGGTVYYLEFAADGTVTSNTSTNPTKIALTTAVLASAALPQFNNASAVRGLFVRKTGAISLVNDATGF